jgi:hypothetical protein
MPHDSQGQLPFSGDKTQGAGSATSHRTELMVYIDIPGSAGLAIEETDGPWDREIAHCHAK